MLGYQGSSNYIVLTNSGVTVPNNVIFDEDNTCYLPTPHAEGEAEEEPAEVGNNSSRHNKHETILDTIVVADPDEQSNRRIRRPFPLNQNAMLAYSFLGSISHAAGPSEPPSYRHAKGDSDWPKWLEAMQSEHKSLTDNHTWSLMDRPNRKVLTGKWTYRLKRGANGEILRHKARWVARGFEQTDGVDYSETFASVVKPMSYKAIFAIAAARDLELEQMDVKTAFLYGNIDEEVYIEQPPEFDNGTGRVCKLNKALYGLKQAPRIWYQTLATFLKDLGFHPLTSDVGVFAKEHTYIAVYVDDLLIAGPSKEEIQKLKKALSKRFDMTDLGPSSYYLGMTITRDRKNQTIRLSQKGYIEKILKDLGMCEAKPQHTPMKTDQIDKTPESYEPTPEIKTWYARAIGSLMYAMLGTRPDIAFAVSYCSRFLAKPTEAHRTAMRRIMRYLKSTTSLCLVYEGEIEPLTGFTDSDWAGDRETRRSTSGYIFNLGSGAISWSSKRQSATALSSCEAEYIGQAQATKEAVWLRRLLVELQVAEEEGHAPIATVIYGDNQGAIALTKNPEFHARTKHIDIQHHFVREKQQSGEVDLRYIPTEQQVADGLTKALPTDKFAAFKTRWD